jgi:predicted XRE-type DNA-binding protein
MTPQRESDKVKSEKQKKLEKAGWRVGSAAEFLALTPAEEAYVEMKLALAHELSEARRSHRLTQGRLATMLKTSQPRVAMMEKGDPSVSLDLLVRALLALGVAPRLANR